MLRIFLVLVRGGVCMLRSTARLCPATAPLGFAMTRNTTWHGEAQGTLRMHWVVLKLYGSVWVMWVMWVLRTSYAKARTSYAGPSDIAWTSYAGPSDIARTCIPNLKPACNCRSRLRYITSRQARASASLVRGLAEVRYPV
jgi:hypothetical protein